MLKIVVALIVLVSSSLAATAAETRSYTVAIDADYAPYEYLDSNGEVRGMLPDLLRAIGRVEGMEFTFVALNWPQAVARLEQGRVDIVNMIKTPEREQRYGFSQPHSRITQALFRNRAHPDITSPEALAGNRVAIQRHDIAADYVHHDAHIVWVDDKREGFNLLEQGRVEALFTAEQPGLFLLQSKQLSHVETVQRGLWPQPYCFAVRNGQNALLEQLNQGLNALHASGEYDRIMEQWFVSHRPWWQDHPWVLALNCALLLSLVMLVVLARIVRQQKILIHNSHGYHEHLLEHLSEAVIVWQQGRAVVANPAALALLQQNTVGEVVSLPLTDNGNHQAYDIQSSLETLQPWPLREMQLHSPAVMHHDVISMAMVTEYRAEPALLIIIRDITQQKKIEREHQRMLEMLDKTSDYVVLSGLDGLLLYANPAAHSLFVNTFTTQQTLEDMHSKSEQELVVSCYLPEAQHRGSFRAETTLQDCDGNLIPVSAVYTAHGGGRTSDAPCYVSMIARDLRQEMSMQSRMEQSQRLESMGKLAGGVAHDFNNIMMAVLGNATLARMRFGENSPATVYLQRIEKSGKRAAELCKQMLAYSGRTHLEMKTVDLTEIVESIKDWIKGTMSSSLLLDYQLSSDPLPVRADTAQVEQVVMNLLINAGEAIGGRQGNIVIRTALVTLHESELAEAHGDMRVSPGEFACLSVSDNGCGMDDHVRDHIFDPFFTTKFSGRGLGMSTVLGVMRGHQGCVRIASQPDQGTEVHLYFPLLALDHHGDSDDEQAIQTDSPPHRHTVLVVDDEDAVRETAALMLEAVGYQTMMASDGAIAVELYQKQPNDISIILLDMSMPGMDGHACFKKLRAINPQVRVLLSSGHTEIEVEQLFMGQKLVGFIAKPYTPMQLQAKLIELGVPPVTD